MLYWVGIVKDTMVEQLRGVWIDVVMSILIKHDKVGVGVRSFLRYGLGEP